MLRNGKRTDPRFMRSTSLDTAAGMVRRERKVQWSSVGWGQEQGQGHGAEETGGKVIISSKVWRRHMEAGSIFSWGGAGAAVTATVRAITTISLSSLILS